MSFFLSTVLPTEGLYCVVGIKSVPGQTHKSIQQTFYGSIDEVQAKGEALSEQGWNAYMAMSTFKDNSSREAANAAYTRAFFLDLDCGKVKNSFVNVAQAAQALRAFVDDTGLPKPFVVHSGNGLHAHWPLEEAIPTEQWRAYAKAFKALCLAKGLIIDPAVPADAARVLRIPGTKNFNRDEPESVAIMIVGDVVPLSRILKCLPTPAPTLDLSAAKAFGMDATTKALVGDMPKSKFSKIVRSSLAGTGCGQIKHALTDAATLEEPLWRAALSVAWHCTDAETSIQKLSQGHPEYSPEATLIKAQQTKGPYTCAWYKENNPSSCAGCKHEITSPIALGRYIEETKAVNGEYIIQAEVSLGESDETVTITSNIPAYPFPYFRPATGGVGRRDTLPDGSPGDVTLYPHDLYVTGRFYDSTETGDGEGEMIGIRLHLPQDGIREFSAPATALMTPDRLRDVLVSKGVIAYGKQLDGLMAYLASSVKQLQTQIRANHTRSQMGWLPDNSGFVLGEYEHTTSGVRLAPPASGTRQLAPLFQAKGSLDEWKKLADFYNTPGLEAHAFALFAGFGAPLVRLLGGATIKGALINLMSSKSGTGKSTVQMLINSIYGHPVDLLMTKNDTTNAMFQRLGMMNNLPFCIDEITNLKPEQLSEFVYGASQGRARHRMDSQANKLRVNNSTWATITISSSNSSVVDMLTSLKASPDGELRRLIELHIEPNESIPKHETDMLFAKLDSNYGVAGPKFLTHIVNNLESIKQDLYEMQRRVDADLTLNQADRFYSVILACTFIGALIAKKLGLHSIDVKRVYKYALGAVANTKASAQQGSMSPLASASEMLGAYLNDNVGNGLIWTGDLEKDGLPIKAAHEPRMALRFRWDLQTDELWIPASMFRDYLVNKQVDLKQSLRALEQAGLLKANRNEFGAVDYAKSKRIAAGLFGGMQTPVIKCYCFIGKNLGFDPEDFAPKGLHDPAKAA